jgi:hypothetical protein
MREATTAPAEPAPTTIVSYRIVSLRRAGRAFASV